MSERILLAGQMGRDAAIAQRLAEEGNELYVVAEYRNPTLDIMTKATGGELFIVEDLNHPHQVARVVGWVKPDIVWINSDELLAKDAAEIIHRYEAAVLLPFPNREAASIEWDKFFARRIIKEIDDELGTHYNPEFRIAGDYSDVGEAIKFFTRQKKEVVVKPQGLSGGKGVKVMGPHLQSYDEAKEYARQIIYFGPSTYEGALIEEKLEGYEFTIQGFTDGRTLIAPPATYDYPYREDGDTGPGTGGMGSFTMPYGEQLPFLNQGDYEESLALMKTILSKLEERGLDYKGVLYGSFFKTADGLKLVAFNARGGDPELINIVELLDRKSSLTNILGCIASRELLPQDVRFRQQASTVMYLVAPEYAYRNDGPRHEFELDTHIVRAMDCRVYFAGAQRIGINHYQTVGLSRTVAIASRAGTPWKARAKIHDAIANAVAGPLQGRQEIGAEDYIRQLQLRRA